MKQLKRDAKFWIQIAAWSLALIVLVGVVVYFNFFAKEEGVTEIAVGNPCPDFTLQMYGENDKGEYALLDDKFTLSEQLGKVVVVNFWATWCGPCVAELPYFNDIATEYPEIKVVAIHGSSTEPVPDFIVRKTNTKDSWRNYNLTFVQDQVLSNNKCVTYKALGGNSSWPMTLIIGKDGKIAYIKQGSMTYDKLHEEVTKALNA